MTAMFMNEPLWFKILITVTFLGTIILSASYFSTYPYLQSGSKLAAAIFFGAFAIKFKWHFKIALLFSVLSVICIFLAVQPLL